MIMLFTYIIASKRAARILLLAS